MNNLSELEKLKFPIGRFIRPETFLPEQIYRWINDIESFPQRLNDTIQPLSAHQLQWKYRPDGWTIHQVIHHCADSHMNSLIRFKLTLTEDNPTIKPYLEAKWAELPDTLNVDPSVSLQILTGVHNRLTLTLRSLSAEDLLRSYYHPEDDTNYSIREAIALYAWHCNHHLAHVQQAISHHGEFN